LGGHKYTMNLKFLIAVLVPLIIVSGCVQNMPGPSTNKEGIFDSNISPDSNTGLADVNAGYVDSNYGFDLNQVSPDSNQGLPDLNQISDVNVSDLNVGDYNSNFDANY